MGVASIREFTVNQWHISYQCNLTLRLTFTDNVLDLFTLIQSYVTKNGEYGKAGQYTGG